METLKIEIPIPEKIKNTLDHYGFDYERNTIEMLRNIYNAIKEVEKQEEIIKRPKISLKLWTKGTQKRFTEEKNKVK